jgi:very-short-patch-repair endonuclease
MLTSPRARGEVGLPGDAKASSGAIRVRGRFQMRDADEIKAARPRRLRRHATEAESALWYQLRSRRLNGRKFVRQEPIGPYTVDLICRESRLVIEVDGGQHADNPRDMVRDKWLVDHNYRVLRFWNNDVLGNMAGVLEAITAALAEAPPHPDR